ncbi:Mo-dependent nitrogenase C-terminal domain-containing protein [Kovacikia minuta CCNUW1]|uniref:Mo-dependent nitrogenase C-terminal domain-containing protein n=1 Tax=Kovacikia minuta TaxID=2931930 RepID=UPI001CCB6B70|nr:Mo-dependent nitrogenase C-terminal domain-containing protein [Kovacikia minuta]UBF25843.1 Mo-dependent nitrogenase C-terminal domain-containing protein [Kovacikia minuta CCNUW1]
MNHLISAHKNGFLTPIRQWLEAVEIDHPDTARFLCRAIPASCPFAREVRFCDRVIVSIPPLCKLNPFYDQIINLRFKSLMYLADQCGEDVTLYC